MAKSELHYCLFFKISRVQDVRYSRCGIENVIASDLKKPVNKTTGKFFILDVTKMKKYEKIVKDHGINYIIHLAAILSGIF